MATKFPKRPWAPWVPKHIDPKRHPEWSAWVRRWNAPPGEVPVCFLDGSPLPDAWREQLLSGQLNPRALQWRVARERHFDTWDDFEVIEEGWRAGWVWAPEPDGGRTMLPPVPTREASEEVRREKLAAIRAAIDAALDAGEASVTNWGLAISSRLAIGEHTVHDRLTANGTRLTAEVEAGRVRQQRKVRRAAR